ncbi:enoyl-CoA hydratase/isomerase family protein [Nocardia aobensis]|uniref:enoyl-CoA hydratase/isomerase family protein n=1 Tax=Nocardia aobensis TaxID=257277 RepID=UPI000688C42B|nr:enoyl-CoA hydratase/isomerase family protein [Nocardia aobensis]
MGDTAYISINRPSRRNALARQVHHDFGTAVESVAQQHAIRFVVVRGTDGVFSSGGDLQELGNGIPEDYITDYWHRMRRSVLALRALDQVVVAAIEGVAVGAGAALALAADIVIADEDARLRFSFTHIGFVPDAGATLSLSRSAGLAFTRDALLTGRWITAREARDAGLIARIAPRGGLDDGVKQALTELRQAPALSLAMTKQLIDASAIPDFEATTRTEGVYQRAISATSEHRRHFAERLDELTRARNSRHHT